MTNMERLLEVMAQLRHPETGCSWDRKQTYASLVRHTLEEAYEVADSIERQALDELPGELGDLLFQVVFYSRIGEEEGRFDFDQVAGLMVDKLVHRHPHVFGDTQFASEAEMKANWEALKAVERQEQAEEPVSILANIPRPMPALSRSVKMQKRCAQVGFDWDNLGDVVGKVHEEIDEVMHEAQQVTRDQALVEEELGDLLFAVTNLARHLEVDPEQALRRANDKFERRFQGVEQRLQDKPLQSYSLDQMEEAWQAVKRSEK